MTNKDGITERRSNNINLKALRDKVKGQCEFVRQSISEMDTRLTESTTVEHNNHTTFNVKVSIR